MAADLSPLDLIVQGIAQHIPAPQQDAEAAPNLRELFLELTTISLGNLYAKMPLPSTLYDRSMLKIITSQIDDTEASKLTGRTEDWLRLEGLIRAAEGQKAYMLNRPSMAVLSTATKIGTLGDVMERLTRAYAEGRTTPEIRSASRSLAAYFLTRIARS